MAIVAELVIETRPGRAASVARNIAAVTSLKGLRVEAGDRLTGTWSAQDGHYPEGLSEALQALDGDVLAAYATEVEFA